MNFGEVGAFLTIVASIIGGLAGVFALFKWLVQRHVKKLDEEIEGLKRDKASLAVRAEGAEKKAERLESEYAVVKQKRRQTEEERDEIRAERDTERGKTKKAVETATINYNAWKREKDLREKAERREKDLAEKINGLEAARAEILAQLEAARSKDKDTTGARDKALKRAAGNAKKVKELQAQINTVMKQDGRVWMKPVPPTSPRFVPLSDRRTVIISVLNLKGGVGKTTVTANLAGYLGETANKRVLVIDADHQRSLSQLLLSGTDRKAAAAAGRTIQHFLTSATKDGGVLAGSSLAVPDLENCWAVTNTDAFPEHGVDQSLDDLEMQLMGRWMVDPDSADARLLMRPALHSDVVRSKFDFVLIDCPPRLTTVCVNALAASDFVLLPVQAEAVSIRSVQHLLARLRELRESGLLENLQVLGLLANMVSAKAGERTSHEYKLLSTAPGVAQVPRVWGRQVRLFKTMLTREHRYAEATRELDDGRALKLAIAYPSIHRQYQDLMTEVEERIHESCGVAGISS